MNDKPKGTKQSSLRVAQWSRESCRLLSLRTKVGIGSLWGLEFFICKTQSRNELLNQNTKTKTFNSLLFVLKKRKGMGNYSKNSIILGCGFKREKCTHIHTPETPCPSLDFLPTSGSQEGLENRERSRWQIRESWLVQIISKHSAHEGPYKYLWVQRQYVCG